MEAEVSRSATSSGRAVQPRRLKSEPLTIEALALPREGQPAGFPSGNVGRYTLDVAVDRAGGRGRRRRHADGDRAQGDRQRAQRACCPTLPALPGWKSYEPKTNVALEPGEVDARATKTVEWLLRPERPGKTTIPALIAGDLRPGRQALRRAAEQADRDRRQRRGDRRGRVGRAHGGGRGAPGVENVIAAEIRPIRVRATPGRSVGRVVPARRRLQGHAGDAAAGVRRRSCSSGRMRDRLARDDQRTSRRRLRSIARRRLRAAEAHRDAGRAARVLRRDRSRAARARCPRGWACPVGGLRLDELGDLLARARAAGRATSRAVRRRWRPATRRGSRPAASRRGQAGAGRDAGPGGGAHRRRREGAAARGGAA